MSFPRQRMRRLRKSLVLRQLVKETQLNIAQMVYPLFVRPGNKLKKAIPSMPGIFQFSTDEVLKEAERAAQAGIRAVLLFGIPSHKDAKGTQAYAANGIIQKTIRLLKKEIPELLCITDLCLCEYTSHGHCGHIQKNGHVLNDPTLELLRKTAVSQAEAGSDMLAPSAMMDGMVGAIRDALDKNGLNDLPIMSYAAKYASHFYGPFRDAAESPPRFGDRRDYQMDFCNTREALREVALDIEEGADIIMVKPALAYLDIISRVKEKFDLPLAAYHVSGEYAMIKAAARAGCLPEKEIVLETLMASRRAGADILISYWAKDVAAWLKQDK
ncbi:MAG: porphobilinogen synthase [Chlamydiota bacterium]|nr:porphobilinogen synthase [Chlamydiota bacterium]